MTEVFYDLTHLSHRAEIGAPSGIDRVDLMFARAFAGSPALAGAVHYGVRRPSFLKAAELAAVVARAQKRWNREASADPVFTRLRASLLGQASAPAQASPRPSAWRSMLARRARVGRFKLVAQGEPARGVVYLNIAQHALERRLHFDWLTGRPDVKPVFFLHDLLPLDYPEFWPAGHEAVFERRVATMFSHARGLIVSSQTVAARAREEFARRRLSAPPLFVRALPSPLETSPQAGAGEQDGELAATPYVVVVGSIEPRKNHLALLNLWRAMIEAGETPPRLVIIGARGWLNAETCALLDRARALRGFVCEAAGLGDAGLRTILRNARALFAPSFAEGYGLPVAEALALGVPVFASDTEIFREISRGRATLLDVGDGAAWRRAAAGLAQGERKYAGAAVDLDSASYFQDLQLFLVNNVR